MTPQKRLIASISSTCVACVACAALLIGWFAAPSHAQENAESPGSGPQTNHPGLEIETNFSGRELVFDFPSWHIGVAEYPAGVPAT